MFDQETPATKYRLKLVSAGQSDNLATSVKRIGHLMKVRHFLQRFNCLILLISCGAYGNTTANDVRLAVNTYLSAHSEQLLTRYGKDVRVEFRIGHLDSRLRMANCNIPLEAQPNSPDSVGRVNIKVSCKGTTPWSIYVPSHVDLYRPVVMPIMPLARGTKLSDAHVELREINIAKLKGSYYTRIEDVIGMEAKRQIKPDKALSSRHLQPPVMILKGEVVFMTASSGALRVKIPGIALSDGRKGQQISIRNRQSKRIVEAKVMGPGQVAVVM